MHLNYLLCSSVVVPYSVYTKVLYEYMYILSFVKQKTNSIPVYKY